jgi:hypothetical protein
MVVKEWDIRRRGVLRACFLCVCFFFMVSGVSSLLLLF